LSKQIRALEDELGVRLFDRDKRSVHLTNSGRIYLEDARQMLEQHRVAGIRALEAHGGNRGDLVIGATSPAVVGELPSIISRYRERFPHVRMQLRMMFSNRMADALRNRTINLAVARAPADDDDIETTLLSHHPYCVVLPRRHRLAAQAQVDLVDLAGETLIAYRRESVPETYDQVIAMCHERGYRPGHIEHVDGVEAKIGLVACGFGVAIMPEPWARTVAGFPELVFKPIAGAESWRYRIMAWWHRGETSPLVSRFVRLAQPDNEIASV
jgi:DNA-binding transcriptional LysR family regulator